MAKQQRKSEVNVSDFLAGNAGAAPKKGKKKGIPEIDSAKALADKAYNANKVMKDAEAGWRAVEAEILGLTAPKYEERAKSGDFAKSFNVTG